jgi:nucleoside phosphorylase
MVASKLGFNGTPRAMASDLLVALGWWWRFARRGRDQQGGWVATVDAPHNVGCGAAWHELGWVRCEMECSGEAKKASRWRIAMVAGRCVVDTPMRVDDGMKVIAVVSGENVREWKNGRCLLGPIDA